MFNLENKITWKELAPSLQAMFKTLQSQITDVKNEVNNINISLGDINDHLTQIDKDITNLNNNITTIIQDTVEDVVGEMMFLNLAPKIGYYQEDKIEVISKYNMNNCPSTQVNYVMQTGFTSDIQNREIMYFMANDGGYEAYSNKINYLFYAYRMNDESNFVFINERLDDSMKLSSIDKYKKWDYENGFCSCGNKWLYMIYQDTDNNARDLIIHNDSMNVDPSRWTFTSLPANAIPNNQLRFYASSRYLPNYNKLICCTVINSGNNSANTSFKFYSYDTKQNKIVFEQELENLAKCMWLSHDSQYSFGINQNTKHLSECVSNQGGSRINQGTGWEKPGFLMDIDNQRLIYYMTDDQGSYYENNTDKAHRMWVTSFKIFYKIPKSVITNNTGTITLMNSTQYSSSGDKYNNILRGIILRDWSTNYSGVDIVREYGYAVVSANNKENVYANLHKQFSFDEKNNRYYQIGTIRDQWVHRRAFRVDLSKCPFLELGSYEGISQEQREGSWKIISEGIDSSLKISTPDTSWWGKQIAAYAVIGNRICLYSVSVQNNTIKRYDILTTNQFKRSYDKSVYKGLISIEPIPNTYYNTASFSGRGVYNRGFFTCVESNGDSYHGFSYIEKTDMTIRSFHYIYNFSDPNKPSSTTEKIIEDDSIQNYFPGKSITWVNNDKIKVSNLFEGFEGTILWFSYNKFGNYYTATVYFDNPNCSYYNCYYLIILYRSTKSYIIYGPNYKDKICTQYWNVAEMFKNKGYMLNPNNSQRNGICSPLFINSQEFIFAIGVLDTAGYNSYSYKRVYIKLTSSLTDIEASNNVDSKGIENGAGYCGRILEGIEYSKDYGYMIMYRTRYAGEPMVILTQKPILPASEEPDRSVDTLQNMFFNSYYETSLFLDRAEEELKHYKHKYCIFIQSSQGLVAYIPSIPIFLGGYFSIIENPIPVTLKPNSDNYIYIERDSNDRTNIIASSSTTRTINEGDKVFNKILCAKCTTNDSSIISVEYYRINTGYNDYSFN